MGVKVKKHSPDYYVTDGDNEIPVEFAPIDGTEVVKYTEDGKRAVVGYLCQEEYPSNPRKEWDNFGVMVCWHGRYELGDEQRTDSPAEFFYELAEQYDPNIREKIEAFFEKHPYGKGDFTTDTWKQVKADYESRRRSILLNVIHKHYVMLPLFLLDHSGITMSTSSGSFSACDPQGWDWGQVGWIYASYEAIRKEWSRKHVTKKLIQKVREVLRSEVETYDQYLTGDVYGVCVNAAINISEDPEEPDWIRADEYGVVGYNSDGTPINGNVWEEACWSYFGNEYAKEERDSQINDMLILLEQAKIATPDDPDQLDLPIGGGEQIDEKT